MMSVTDGVTPRPVELLTGTFYASNPSLACTTMQVGTDEVILFEHNDTQGVLTYLNSLDYVAITELIVDGENVLATFEAARGSNHPMTESNLDNILPLHFDNQIRLKGKKRNGSGDTTAFQYEIWRTE